MEKERNIDNSPKVWFCADTHFGHKNILKHCPGRREEIVRWATKNGIPIPEDEVGMVSLMDKWIIDVWNSTVHKNDSVYILGDFSFHPTKENEVLVSKLHGKKFLILGNHDKSSRSMVRFFKYIKQIEEYKCKSFMDGNDTICFEMCHFPMRSWNRMQNGTLHIHGHCHNKLSKENFVNGLLRVDVGWDSDLARFNLVSPQQIVDYFRQFTKPGETFEEYAKRTRCKNWVVKTVTRIKNKVNYKQYVKNQKNEKR